MDCDDYKVELVRGLSEAWELARSEVSKAQHRQKQQYDKKAKAVDYRQGDRVMAFMLQETSGKDRKLALPYHGPYRVVEVWPNCLLVRLVDRPQEELILVSSQRVVECSDALPDTSWLGKGRQRRRRRRRRGEHCKYNLRDV